MLRPKVHRLPGVGSVVYEPPGVPGDAAAAVEMRGVPIIQLPKPTDTAFGVGCIVRLIFALALVVGTLLVLWYRFYR